MLYDMSLCGLMLCMDEGDDGMRKVPSYTIDDKLNFINCKPFLGFFFGLDQNKICIEKNQRISLLIARKIGMSSESQQKSWLDIFNPVIGKIKKTSATSPT